MPDIKKAIRDLIISDPSAEPMFARYKFTDASPSPMTSFDQSAKFVTEDTSGPNVSFRGIIIPTYLSNAGVQIRIRWQAHETIPMTLNSVYFGETDTNDKNVINNKEVLFGGVGSVVIPAATDTWSDWFDYIFDPSKKYSMSFDIQNAGNGYRYAPYTIAGVKTYMLAGLKASDATWSDDTPTGYNNILWGFDMIQSRIVAVNQAAIFTAITQDAIIPEDCGYPAGIIEHVSAVPFGVRENRGGEGLYDIRIYSGKYHSESTLHDLSWLVWETVNRAYLDLTVDGYEAILCVANPPVQLFDSDGFPAYLIQCRVLFLES